MSGGLPVDDWVTAIALTAAGIIVVAIYAFGRSTYKPIFRSKTNKQYKVLGRVKRGFK
jgi:hypothetical protein